MEFPHPENIDPLTHALEVLEFPKVLEHIAKKCVSERARQMVLNTRPTSDIELIRIRSELIEEIRQLLAISGQPELAGLGDPEEFIDRAAKEGILSEEELWQVAQVSRIVHNLTRIGANRERFPNLRAMLDGLEDTPAVHGNIERFILPPGVFKEDASERLAQLRIAKKQVHDRLQEKLESMLEDERYADFWQEKLITIRNERFVLPLKAEHKQHLPGVIHDRSASGATIFVEPLEIVPLNNQLRELELEERAEKLRILRNLSGIVGAYSEQLLANLSILHQLDFLVAVAHFADEIGANSVSVAPGNPLSLRDARHPLLVLEKGREGVVPLDIDLPPKVRGLIITGPNMGGKTVALKTVGLLSVMAACGFPVPADSKSQIPLFEKFFADIGDEQSVEASLSSFASHIVHYKIAAENCDEKSLVLFDELGSATDPQEAMPLSWALFEYILDRGAMVVANTHLGGLMGLAASREDVENGAMEFDQDRMEPTYRFLLGVPGKSWAMEIAKLLGLPEKILVRAREIAGGGTALDEIISQLQRRLAEVEDLRRRLDEQSRDLTQKREILEGLLKANQIKERELERVRRSYEEMRETRLMAAIQRELEKIETEWQKIVSEKPPEPKKRQRAERFIQELKRRLKRAEKQSARKHGMPKQLEPGQRVFVYRLHKWGEVLDPTDEQGFVRVLVGNLPLKIHSSGVDTETEYERKRRASKRGYGEKKGIHYEPREAPQKIDVRGMYPEEAWEKVDKILDDAVASGAEKILIVHGKGKGTLRRYIRDKLHADPRVARMMLPSEREGGDGATIAVLSSDNVDNNEGGNENGRGTQEN